MVGGDRNCRGPKECINGDECNEIKSELTSYAGKVIAEEELKGFKKKKKLLLREPKSKRKLC